MSRQSRRSREEHSEGTNGLGTIDQHKALLLQTAFGLDCSLSTQTKALVASEWEGWPMIRSDFDVRT